MESFKIETRYMKRVKTVIRCMRAALYRPDYQKLLRYPLIKRLGRAFASKHGDEPLKRSTELLKHSPRV